ncbi:MAG: hypothetical protein WCS56_06340, partial [Bacilli bacterium]
MALEYEDIIVYSDKVFFAKKHPNTIEELNGVLTKTAHSFYEFNITYDISNDLFINNKDLKKLKQIFIEKLDAKYFVLNRKIVNESLLRAKSTKKSFKPQLAIQIETKAQYDVVKNYPYDKLYIRNEKLYQELNNDSYYLVTDRVIENASKLTKTKNLLVSDYTYLNQQDRIIDCSSYLNAYNSLTVKTLINNGAKIVYLSYELSAADILKIPLKDIKGHVGIVLYSKYDVMLTKNNIINKDSPVNFDDHYYLQDEYGNNYPLVNENTNLRIVSYKENNLL